MKKYLAFAAVLVASVSAMAFQPRMSTNEVNSEIRERLTKGETSEVVARAGKAAELKSCIISAGLIEAGKTHSEVLKAMIAGGADAVEVINCLVTQGAERDNMNKIAIAAGADPTKILEASAAGAGGNNNFGGNSFSNSVSSTVGGSGGTTTSASRS